MLRFELCSVAFNPSYSPHPSNLAERSCNFFTRFILLFIVPCRVPRGYEFFLLRSTIFRLFALFTTSIAIQNRELYQEPVILEADCLQLTARPENGFIPYAKPSILDRSHDHLPSTCTTCIISLMVFV